ncbi:MAG: response regulator transcription factor [Chthoniobacter sp.]|uniref:response regulator transcription factor n=1 Tax=Chthoniobacter sp. TaxID=2510640 RepID=UPI0032AC29EC
MSTHQETILIIEDDPVMLRGLKDNFEFEGYHVQTASDGDAGLKLALALQPALIILDLMLPKVNGYEVCRFLREEKLDMPIIMLTAKGQESDVVLGLKLGADDYVTKPFSIKELLARVEAFLRRHRHQQGSVITFGDCRLDTAARLLVRAGQDVPLSPKEFELLVFLATNAGRALSRDRIMSSVWGYDCRVTPRSIDRFVNALRNKIEFDPAEPRILKTVREFGYKFELPAVA